eukprot:UN03493
MPGAARYKNASRSIVNADMGDSDELNEYDEDLEHDDQQNEDDESDIMMDEDEEGYTDENNNEPIPQFGKCHYLTANIFDYDGVEPILNELMNVVNQAKTAKDYPTKTYQMVFRCI